MTHADVLAMIDAAWPRKDEDTAEMMNRSILLALDRQRVTPEAFQAAVLKLIDSGHEYRPTASAIMLIVNQARRLAAQGSVPESRQIGPGEPDPLNVEEAKRLLAALVAKAGTGKPLGQRWKGDTNPLTARQRYTAIFRGDAVMVDDIRDYESPLIESIAAVARAHPDDPNLATPEAQAEWAMALQRYVPMQVQEEVEKDLSVGRPHLVSIEARLARRYGYEASPHTGNRVIEAL